MLLGVKVKVMVVKKSKVFSDNDEDEIAFTAKVDFISEITFENE